jgi:DNA polymerase III subunit epsilon
MGVGGLINLPVPEQSLIDVLRRHPTIDVVVPMEPMRRREDRALSTAVVHGAVVDVETTGTDVAKDVVIQLAIQLFGADADGRIVEAGTPQAWFEDPGFPLSEIVKRKTGIDDAMLRGKGIHDGPAYSMLRHADVIIAHNSGFDRNFLERRLPGLEDRRWACSLTEVDWEGLGFEARKLKLIALEMNMKYSAHRADEDVNALLHVLDHLLPDGTTVLSKLLARAALPSWRLTAYETPHSASELLRDRGWRWNRDRRCWWIEVADDAVDVEEEWAVIHVYKAIGAPDRFRLDATTRFRRW